MPNGARGQGILRNRQASYPAAKVAFKNGAKGQPQTHGLNDVHMGSILFDTFPGAAFAANWSTFGATPPTVSGGNAVFTSGSGVTTWDRGVRDVTKFTNLHNFTLEVKDVQITFTPAANTFGIGIGLDPVADNNTAKTGIGAYVDMSTGANGGRMRIGKLNATRGWTIINENAAGTITKALNNVFDFILQRVEDVLYFRVRNVTAGTEFVTLQAAFFVDTSFTHFLPNRGLVSIYGVGTSGTTTVGSVNFISDEHLTNHYCLLGDSIGAGYNAGGRLFRFMYRAFAGIHNRRWMSLSEQGSKVQDFYAGNSNEITSYNITKAYIIQVGTNNVEHDTLASYQTGITAIVDAIVAAGRDAILCTLLPRNDGLDVRPFNDWLYTTFAPKKATVGTYGRRFKICDFYTGFRDYNYGLFDGNRWYYGNATGVDNVHADYKGNSRMGTILMNCIKQYEQGII